MDCGKVVSEPAWQPDIGYRAVSGSEALSQLGERGSGIRFNRKDQAFAAYDRARQGHATIYAPGGTREEHIRHAGLDREPCQRVRGLDEG